MQRIVGGRRRENERERGIVRVCKKGRKRACRSQERERERARERKRRSYQAEMGLFSCQESRADKSIGQMQMDSYVTQT